MLKARGPLDLLGKTNYHGRDADALQRLGIAEQPAAGHAGGERFEIDTAGLEVVLDDVSPRQDGNAVDQLGHDVAAGFCQTDVELGARFVGRASPVTPPRAAG